MTLAKACLIADDGWICCAYREFTSTSIATSCAALLTSMSHRVAWLATVALAASCLSVTKSAWELGSPAEHFPKPPIWRIELVSYEACESETLSNVSVSQGLFIDVLVKAQLANIIFSHVFATRKRKTFVGELFQLWRSCVHEVTPREHVWRGLSVFSYLSNGRVL